MKYKLSVASRLHPGLPQAELDIPAVRAASVVGHRPIFR
jgi:hypothetical protein